MADACSVEHRISRRKILCAQGTVFGFPFSDRSQTLVDCELFPGRQVEPGRQADPSMFSGLPRSGRDRLLESYGQLRRRHMHMVAPRSYPSQVPINSRLRASLAT